jgi:hypothetical protein
MNVIEKLLGLRPIQDLTETTWWTETVFRELERDVTAVRGIGSELAAPPADPPAEME